MKTKEARRLYVLEELQAGRLTNREAAKRLNLSRRQIIRLKQEFREKGAKALVHGNRGTVSQRQTAMEDRQKVIELAKGEYEGASNAHLADILEEELQIILSPKTVGRIRQAAGIKNPHGHKAPKIYKRRPRRGREGELLQIDASIHDWLEERGPRLSLHGAIDDATGKVVGVHFRLQEESWGYLEVLKQVLTNYGVPQSIYSDRHSIFQINQPHKLKAEDEIVGSEAALTQFGRALFELGVERIAANSPQAKGRIERLWGTFQNRLTVEMRAANILTLEEANRFLPDYVAKHNRRFAVVATETDTAYLKAPPTDLVDVIIAKREVRKIQRGSCFSYQNQLFQLVDPQGQVLLLREGKPIEVVTSLDGHLGVWYKQHLCLLLAFERQETVQQPPPPVRQREAVIPTTDHPWRAKGVRSINQKNNLAPKDLKPSSGATIPRFEGVTFSLSQNGT